MTHEPFNWKAGEAERYELREGKPYRFKADRREFVQTVGAGLVVAVATTDASAQRRGRQNERREELLSQRFHLSETGEITTLTSKVEIGQGSRTQITQAVAEELNVAVSKVRLVMADTAICPDDGGTAGSRTTPSTIPRVRQAAASLRQVLLRLAAEQLGVDTSDLTLIDNVFQSSNGRQVTLGELIRNEQATKSLQAAAVQEDVSITSVTDWKVLGTSVPRIDARHTVTGEARFPSDIVRPEMLYGKVVRPPAYHATLESIDVDAAASVEGAFAVRDGDFVGCVATTSWDAEQARIALAATAKWQYDAEQQPSSATLFEHLKNTAQGNLPDSPAATSADATRKWFTSQYSVSYIQHAPMEPRVAVAEWTDGHLTVWTGTQQPSRVHSQLCESFRLPTERVRVIVPDTGGGFGGKHSGEAAVEAARLAKTAGKPVHLRWTREEEFVWAYFRPAGRIEVEAEIDDRGKLIEWQFINYNSGGSAIDTPYAVPNARSRFVNSASPLRQGSYRALAATANTFARECAMDELAGLTRSDPLEFRLRHLAPGRLKDVLQAAATKFDWNRRAANRNKGRGIGIACGTEKGSYVATCAEVEVIDNRIRVLDVCQTFECGAIQNPANLRRQVEGCMIMGLGAALYEQIEFADGKITNPSFSSYRVPRARDVPPMEIELLDRPDLESVGGSETPIIAIAPAIANAVYAATGQRCRSMPIRLG